MHADDVTVTILTGARPGLLADTLTAVVDHAPGLLETALVIVLHNGDDPETAGVLDTFADLIDGLQITDELLDVGPATSRLAVAAQTAGRPWWLHLEDDWRCTPGDGWLDDARRILETEPRVSQVRLRLADEPVLSRHMVTREPIRWREMPGYRVAADAHWTNNPALMRAVDAGDAWPAAGEREAQRRWHRAGHRGVAQLVPGVFGHTGDGESLRKATGSPL